MMAHHLAMPGTETRVPPLLAAAEGCAPAPLHWRALALLLDGVLALTVAGFIFTAIVAPEYYPDAGAVVESQMQAAAGQWDAALRANNPAPIDLNSDFLELAGAWLRTAFGVMLVYFAASEWAMRGMTLGKKCFSLRTAQLGTGEPPRAFDTLIRSLAKSVSLLAPVFLLVNILPMALSRHRRAGHDYFARTLVTGDPSPEEADAVGNENGFDGE